MSATYLESVKRKIDGWRDEQISNNTNIGKGVDGRYTGIHSLKIISTTLYA